MVNNLEKEPILERIQSAEFQERLARDSALAARIQDGFTPEEPSEENPRPLVIDGNLSTDASEALGELYEHYQPLIRRTANRAYNRMSRSAAYDVEDLMSAGFEGLFRAALKWSSDKSRGGFLGYTKQYITGCVYGHGEEVSSCIRLSDNMRADVKRYRRTYWDMYSKTEKAPTRKRIAKAMGRVTLGDVDELARVEAMTYQMGSLDRGYFADDHDEHSTYGSEEGRWQPIGPSVTEMQQVEEYVLSGTIKSAMHSLLEQAIDENRFDERSLRILQLRFFGKDGNREPLTLDEIANELDLSRERIRQLEFKALSKLRRPGIREKIEDFLYQ